MMRTGLLDRITTLRVAPFSLKMGHIGIIIAILGAAIGTSSSTVSAYGLPKLAALVFGATLIWLEILRRAFKGEQEFHWQAMLLPTAIFMGAAIVATIGSRDWSLSIFGNYRTYAHCLITYTSLFALAFGVAYSREWISNNFVINLILISGLLVLAYAVLQHHGLTPIKFQPFWVTDSGKPHLYSSLGHPVYLGMFLTALFPLAIDYMREPRPFYSYLGQASVIALILMAALTYKRGVWGGMAVGAFVYLWLSGQLEMNKKRWAVISIFLVFCGIYFGASFLDKSGDLARLDAWKIAAMGFVENPMAGHGPDTFHLLYRKLKTFTTIQALGSTRHVHFDAHNDLLQVAATMGFYGIVAYFTLVLGFIFTIYDSIKTSGNVSRTAALAAGVIGVWFLAKINPLSVGVMTICAVLAGLLMRANHHYVEPNLSRPAMRAGIVFAVLACVSLFVGRAVAGDYYYYESEKSRTKDPLESAQKINRAAHIAPWVFEIRKRQADSLYFLPLKATKENGLRIIEEAVKIGESCLRYHPSDSRAHILYAHSLLIREHWGGPAMRKEALASMRKAQDLAPLFMPLMKTRAMIAQLSNDRKEAMRAGAKHKVMERMKNGI